MKRRYYNLRTERTGGTVKVICIDELNNLWEYHTGLGGSQQLYVNGIERPALLKVFMEGDIKNLFDKCITVV